MALDDASTVTPQLPTALAGKKSKVTKKKKAAKPVNLCALPMWVSTTNLKKHRVVAIAHKQKWVVGNADMITGDIANELSSNHQWSHKGPFGKRIMPGNPEYMDMLPLKAFLHMMPPAQLVLVLELTNARLAAKEKREMTCQELLRWIGVCMLIASINFHGDRRKLWEGGSATSKYFPSYDLCATGMSHNRFDNILYAVRWSRQPPKQPDGMSSERYRWMLVDDFIDNIKEYHSRTFDPGDHLEADKTVIRWYGIGGAFVDAGLPMYLALERKLNNGGKIQNLSNMASGIMLHLKVLKLAKEEKAISTNAAAANKEEDNCNDNAADKGGKGTRVLLELMEPWHHSGRVVIVNVYFASVKVAMKMKEKGLIFIRNVKQCSRRFPMEVLGNATLAKRGS